MRENEPTTQGRLTCTSVTQSSFLERPTKISCRNINTTRDSFDIPSLPQLAHHTKILRIYLWVLCFIHLDNQNLLQVGTHPRVRVVERHSSKIVTRGYIRTQHIFRSNGPEIEARYRVSMVQVGSSA